MKFSDKLKKLRKENNLTQDELADKLFVTRTAVSKWETDNGYPSIESLKLLSKLFHTTIDELISDEDIKNKKHLEDKIAKNFVVADMIGVPIDKIHLPKGKFAVIIGNEGQGVGNDLAKLSEIKVSIPMTDKVESLNAGVAGSIIMQKLSEV